jgi:hypothetical protein
MRFFRALTGGHLPKNAAGWREVLKKPAGLEARELRGNVWKQGTAFLLAMAEVAFL